MILVFIYRMSYSIIHIRSWCCALVLVVELSGFSLEDTLLQAMVQCQMSVSPPRGNFDFKFACLVVLFVRLITRLPVTFGSKWNCTNVMINRLVRMLNPQEWSKVGCGTANNSSEKSLRKETIMIQNILMLKL